MSKVLNHILKLYKQANVAKKAEDKKELPKFTVTVRRNSDDEVAEIYEYKTEKEAEEGYKDILSDIEKDKGFYVSINKLTDNNEYEEIKNSYLKKEENCKKAWTDLEKKQVGALEDNATGKYNIYQTNGGEIVLTNHQLVGKKYALMDTANTFEELMEKYEKDWEEHDNFQIIDKQLLSEYEKYKGIDINDWLEDDSEEEYENYHFFDLTKDYAEETKTSATNKKAENEDLIEVGWSLYSSDEDMIQDLAEDMGRRITKNFWDKINKDISKVERWFLREGYRQFFTKVRDEGHGSNGDLGGTAWMTKQQLQDFISQAEKYDENSYAVFESDGTLGIDVSHDDAVVFHSFIYIDDKDLDKLGIEAKKVNKNKKQSSKANAMRKRAYSVGDYLSHFNDVQQYALTENKGDLGKAVEYLLTFASSEYDKKNFPREYVYKLVKKYIDDTVKFQEMINHPIKEEYIAKAKELLNNYKIENKIATKTNKLHKQAKIVLEQIGNEYYLNGKKGDYSDFNYDGKYKQTNYNVFVDDKGKTHKVWEFAGTLGKKADLSKDFDDAESFAKKIIEENKHSFSDYADMQKLENNASSMYFMDIAEIKEILDEAKKMVSEIDSDKNKKLEDANLYFGMKDKALLAEKVLEEKQKQEKQSSKNKAMIKKAVLQVSENGMGYVLPNGQVVYPGDEALLKSEKRANERMLEKDKKELERLEKIVAEYPDINFDRNPDSVKFQIPRLKKGIEYLELFNETIDDILNAFKENKLPRQATKKTATIKHENGVYNVYSESGKCLGKGYKTKEEAEKRLKQVEYFKHKDKKSLKNIVISKMAENEKIDWDHIWGIEYNGKKYILHEQLGGLYRFINLEHLKNEKITDKSYITFNMMQIARKAKDGKMLVMYDY